MQQQLPRNLLYNDVKPIGFPSHVRQEKYTPIAFNTSTNGVASSDVVRFNISTNGFWDPYSAYVKLEVDVSGMDGNQVLSNWAIGASSCNAAGALQVDNSALSFVNQLIIYKGGTEIERVEEYDTIGAILNDMNSAGENRLCRSFEGMYSQNTSAGLQYQNPLQTMNSQTSVLTTSLLTVGYSPIQFAQPQVNQQNVYNSINNANNTVGVPIYRYEFLLGQDGHYGIQTSDNGGDGINQGFSLGGLRCIGNSSTTTNLSPQYGYVIPFNTSLSSFGNETLMTNNFYVSNIYKGMPQAIVPNKCTFCVPILSGLLGVLMPKESYKYIPMKALQELIIEFRLNPYAMFTSGYADGSYNSNYINGTVAMGSTGAPMLSRIWRITKFEINVEVQYFEPIIENIILSQLNTEKGIVIHTNSWMLGPRYQFSANTSPSGTYQVNLGFESLRNVIWVFIPDEFTQYSFCRKQFRLSANITQVYVKVGSEYYPPLPITGHGGTPACYQSIIGDNDYNNAEFLIQLYKCFGKFQDIQQNSIINPINFAVNQRAYNPSYTLQHYNSSTTKQQNYDTSAGQPLFHENRCVGRAIYAMNLETLNQDYSVISGINTINNRPFEITLKSDSTNSYKRPFTMYVFCQYDMLIQLKTSGVQILGRG